MGLFDFLKSNKNIITDNGTNYIYYDNGKGSIKEKFIKINGVLNGEYIKYNKNGTFNIKTFKNGVIPLTEEEILINNRKEEIKNNIKVEISKLKIIDDLISEISGIFLLVQMENAKINYYSKLIEEKFINNFDGDYIKFYLYTKRNYFIKELIEYNLDATIEIGSSFNEIDIVNYYNKVYTDHLINYLDNNINYEKNIDLIKINHSDYSFVKSNILGKLFENFKLNCSLSINCDGKGINKDIFKQHSLLFGLNFNTYKLIYEIIDKKSNGFKYDMQDKDNIEMYEDLLEILRIDPYEINNKTQRKPTQEDIYAQNVVNEILSLCTNNKVNQEDIVIKL
jgi:hypothetical protein